MFMEGALKDQQFLLFANIPKRRAGHGTSTTDAEEIWFMRSA